MLKKIAGLLAVFSAVAFTTLAAPSAQASMIVLGSDATIALGINELVVGSDIFDATFVRQRQSDSLNNPGNAFETDEAGAALAANSIATVLNANGILSAIQSIAGLSASDSAGFRNIYITQPGPLAWTGADVFTNPGVSSWRYTGQLSSNINVEVTIALFEKTGVLPEPGTIALFGLGLAGLGFARRKKA